MKGQPEPIVRVKKGRIIGEWTNQSTAAASTGIAQSRVSQLINTGKPHTDGTFFMRKSEFIMAASIMEPVEQQKTTPSTAVTDLLGCPNRVVRSTDTGTEWTCGRIPGGRYYCQQTDPGSCRLNQYAGRVKREGQL